MLRLLFQYLLVLCLACCAVFAHAQQSTTTKSFNVHKSDNDSREYRYLTLSNQLRVLLVSDPGAEKSAAALNVHVGSHQNPKDRPGLAHFLEHMLFLGTEKYPSAGEYQEFISQHGGSNNAYTAAENTNYYFDVEHGALEQALDRFAQFFIAPSFDANYIEHEKNAVNAEFLAKINDDEMREWDVFRSIFNPEHPAALFDVGNLGALADRENDSIRDDLIAFYQEYYSANLMTLVVVSHRKLDDIQKIVEPRFSLVPNKNRVLSAQYPNLFVPANLPASVSLRPIKETRQLTLAFPMPNYSQNYKSKPLHYLGNLLGDEASGSILALLKDLGWAESVSVGELYRSRSDSLFGIRFELTREGAKAKDQIVSIVFDYLKTVSLKGVAEWRFTEMQQIGDINYRFRDKSNALDSVVELSQAMHDYPAQDVLLGDFAYTKYDEDLLKKALSHLNKNNLFVSFVAPEVQTAIASSYYNVSYSASRGIPDILELKPQYHQKLSLPERNIFIPKNFVLKAPAMLPSTDTSVDKNNPVLILNSENVKLWFLQDKKFRSPKAELNFRFKLPMLNSSLENAARAQLYTALIADQLNEYAYPASLVGSSFKIKANARGFELNVAGYTDKQSLLMNKILSAIGQPSFSESRFELVKDNLIRDWRNEDKNLPYSVLAKKIPRLQYLPYWGDKEYIDTLQKTSFSQFKQFSAELLRGAKLEALFYGNLYPQDAVKLVTVIDHQLLKKRSQRLPQLAKVLRVENKENKSWMYVYPLEHNDRAVELYVQGLGATIDDTAHMKLLTQILEPRFFNQLRTEKQLGYVVSVYSMPIRNVEGSFFVVQSPTTNATILIDEMVNFLSGNLANIAEDFADNKSALLAILREPALSLNEQSEKFWQSILLNDYSFSRQQDLIVAVSKITPESLRKYYEAAFLQKGRRLWLATEKPENLKDFEIIQNVAGYQQKQQGYLQQ